MVLAHALRDGGVRDGKAVPGTSKKLAVLVGEGRLSTSSLDELSVSIARRFTFCSAGHCTELISCRTCMIMSFQYQLSLERRQTIFNYWVV